MYRDIGDLAEHGEPVGPSSHELDLPDTFTVPAAFAELI
jgi:hypothetical protein